MESPLHGAQYSEAGRRYRVVHSSPVPVVLMTNRQRADKHGSVEQFARFQHGPGALGCCQIRLLRQTPSPHFSRVVVAKRRRRRQGKARAGRATEAYLTVTSRSPTRRNAALADGSGAVAEKS